MVHCADRAPIENNWSWTSGLEGHLDEDIWTLKSGKNKVQFNLIIYIVPSLKNSSLHLINYTLWHKNTGKHVLMHFNICMLEYRKILHTQFIFAVAFELYSYSNMNEHKQQKCPILDTKVPLNPKE